MPPITSVGLPLNGKQLPRLSPNMTRDEQTGILNDVIDRLNSNSQNLVASGNVTLTLPATQSGIVLTIPHNLGYKPRAFVYMDSVNYDIEGVVYPDSNVPLPTYTQNGPDGSGNMAFTDWLDYFVDAVNLNIHWNSAVFYDTDKSLPLKYFLEREPAN